MIPEKRIVTPQDLERWVDSATYNLVVEFVEALQDSAEGLVNNDPSCADTPVIKALLAVLTSVNDTITNHPVVAEKESSRFGKGEFRDFYDDVKVQAPRWAATIPGVSSSEGSNDSNDSTNGSDDKGARDASHVDELAAYFTESFGNRTRIDYGSGHELNFMCFLLCLRQMGLLKQVEYSAVVLRVFPEYMKVMRRLQKEYWLEPAGSHGVWGLDDYHFLPFLFGASQLATHPHMKPKSIHTAELVEMYAKDYMYLECIQFINHIKTIPNQQGKLSLRWHSPMLDDISAAKTWRKIKDGMVKMYKAEVLGKLPIMQHFLFGELIPCPEGIEAHHEVEDECGHVHAPAVNTWGDCCGIKIPSAFAASESVKNTQKPMPFD
ncbi:serine/threonine-protein phosphatase 2A activator 2 [Diutina catenulata]